MQIRHRSQSSVRQCKRLISVLCGLMLQGCTADMPALRQAIAEVATRPESARIKLRPFAEQGNETAIAQICIAYGRSMDYRVRGDEREQAFGWCLHAATAGDTEAQYHLGNFFAWGVGTEKNSDQARHWYAEAAAHGHNAAEDAQRVLEGKPPICRNWLTGCRLF